MNSGVLYAALAYGAWGLLPIFFKQLSHVSAFEVVAHRMVWALVFLLCAAAQTLGLAARRDPPAQSPAVLWRIGTAPVGELVGLCVGCAKCPCT